MFAIFDMGTRIAVSYQFDSIIGCKEILNTMAKCASYNEQQTVISSTFMSNLILSTTTINRNPNTIRQTFYAKKLLDLDD